MSIPITLVDSPCFGLLYDPGCPCLYATWRGQHHLALTRTGYELIVQFIRLTRSTKLLNDSLLDENGWQELTSWIARDCFTQLAHEGLQAVAWVLPRNMEALRDTQRVLQQFQSPLVDTFLDVEAAYAWVRRWPVKGV